MSFTASKQSGDPPRSIFNNQLFDQARTSRTATLTPEGVAVATETSATPLTRVAYATTANMDLSGTETIDGGSPATNDSILVWQQSTPSQNGIYSYNASGTWTRTGVEIQAGMVIEVLQGTLYGDHLFLCTNNADPLVGTDAVAFAPLPSGVGTANFATRWTSSSTLGTGLIKDDNTRVQIGSSATTGILNVERSSTSAATLYARNSATTGSGTAAYLQADSDAANSYVAELHATGGGNAALAQATGSGNGIDVSVVDGIGVSILPTGVGIGLSVSRNNTSATAAVVSFVQDAGSGAQTALAVRNDSTNSAAGGLFCTATGGIGGFFQSDTNTCSYSYRNTNTATQPTVVVWQDHAGDANDALYVRSNGTGNAFVVSDGGATNTFAVEDGGVINMRGSGVRYSTTSKSANYTLTKSDYLVFCLTSTASAGFTITLPTPAAGMTFVLVDKENNAATKNVTLARSGSEKIDNVSSNKTLNTNTFRTIVWSDGTDWFTK